MASKKFLELQDMTQEQLVSEHQLTLNGYNKMKIDHAIKGLENPLALREARRDVARLASEIRRRELQNVDPSTRSKIRARRRRNK